MEQLLLQAAALPFVVDGEELRVLMITSRGTRRWVIPKGNIDKGLTSAQAAALEAYEEAGVRGVIDESPLGAYTYNKRLNGRVKLAKVDVFPLRVEKQLKKWPEQAERRFEWMSVEAAAKLVEEPGLAALILRLRETHGSPRASESITGDIL